MRTRSEQMLGCRGLLEAHRPLPWRSTLRRSAPGHEERTSVRPVTPCVQGLVLGQEI